MQGMLTLPQAAQMVVAWSLVHGFAMLLLDDPLRPGDGKLPCATHERRSALAVRPRRIARETFYAISRRLKTGER
jgi:hypothetical protein